MAVWTPEREAEAKRLYIVEGKSAAETVRILGGITRNAVIGVAHRRGWLRESRQKAAAPARLRAPAVPRQTYAKPPKPGPQGKVAVVHGALKRPASAPPPAAEAAKGRREAFLVVPDTAKPLLAAGGSECRWPFGERAETQFCCAPVAGEGPPYCPKHRALAYQPVPTKAKEFERSLRRFA